MIREDEDKEEGQLSRVPAYAGVDVVRTGKEWLETISCLSLLTAGRLIDAPYAWIHCTSVECMASLPCLDQRCRRIEQSSSCFLRSDTFM